MKKNTISDILFAHIYIVTIIANHTRNNSKNTKTVCQPVFYTGTYNLTCRYTFVENNNSRD